MAREQVGDLSQPSLRPTASPVDTFVQPNAGSGLSQLARGLATIAPSLSRFSDDLFQKDAQAKMDAGREKARAIGLEAKQLAKAVKDGVIPEAANPYFRAGLFEQMGRVAGDQFGAQLMTALNTDDRLKDSTSLADFESYANEARAKFLQEHGTDGERFFSNGFGNMSDAWIHNARQQFANDVSERMSKMSDEALSQRTMAGAQQALDAGISHEQIGQDLTRMLDDQYTLNPGGGRRAQLSVVEGLVRLARAKGDATILDIIKNVKSGAKDAKGERLGLDTTSYGAKALDEVAGEIGQKKLSMWDIAEKTRAHNAEAIKDDFISKFIASDAKESFDIEPFAKSAAPYDPQAVEWMRQFKSEWVSADYAGNPQVEAEYYTRVFERGDVTMSQLAHAYVGTHEISKQTFVTLANEMQQQAQAAREGKTRGLFGADPDLQKVKDRVYRAFVTEQGQSAQEQKQRADLAQSVIAMRYMQAKDAGQFTTPEALEKWTAKQVQDAVINYNDDITRGFSVKVLADLQKRMEQGGDAGEPADGALPDWAKRPVVSKDAAFSMKAQWDALEKGTIKALPEETRRLLALMKLPKDKKAVKEFIMSQYNLTNR